MIRRMGVAGLLAFALVIGLSAQAQEKSNGVLVTAEELKKLVEPSLLTAGRSVRFSLFVSTLYLHEGVVYDIYTDDSGNGATAKAQWRLDGDKVCRTNPPARPIETCRHWYRLADGSYEGRLVPGEQLEVTFRTINKP